MTVTGTLATWRLDTASIDRGTFALVDADNEAAWMTCEHPVSVRHFCGLQSGLGH